MSKSNSLLDFAREIAREAGELLMLNFGSKHNEVEKESFHSIVTDIDISAESLLVSKIRNKFPEHSIVSEEAGFSLLSSEYCWVIDPIDGSSYFARGLPTFSVSIALLYKGHLILGVIENPCFKETFYAVVGGGAFLNGALISVSKVSQMNQSVVNFGHRFIRLNEFNAHATKLLKSIRSIRGGGSCAQELCQIACGRMDGLVTLNQSSWDFFAGKLILEEAGGKLTNLLGREISVVDALSANTDIIASNRLIHSKFL